VTEIDKIGRAGCLWCWEHKLPHHDPLKDWIPGKVLDKPPEHMVCNYPVKCVHKATECPWYEDGGLCRHTCTFLKFLGLPEDPDREEANRVCADHALHDPEFHTNSWGISFSTMFDMSADSWMFHTSKDDKDDTPREKPLTRGQNETTLERRKNRKRAIENEVKYEKEQGILFSEEAQDV
jgi:hypothetical protein